MKISLKIFLLLAIFIIIPYVNGGVFAASLKFDKTTVSVLNGETFQINVTVDPESASIISADSYIAFDSTLLKATVVTAGTLFPTVSHDESTAGKVYIAGMVNDPNTPVKTTGTLATITFQALKDGTATLSFDCNTSKIIKDDINASDVMTCAQNNSSVVTIGASGGISPTSAPISELPESGVFDNVFNIAVPGMFLLLIGGIFRLLL
jgi:hypothetical protein